MKPDSAEVIDVGSKASYLSSNAKRPFVQLDPNGMAARIILAFLTTAGIFYINIMPAVVSGLKEGLSFTSQQAGFVSSANLYGAAVGALLAVILVKSISWRRWSYGLLFMLLAIDGLSIFIVHPEVMIAIRAIHGLVGGLLVGIGFAVISRTTEPDKSFGYLLFIQWGLGGLGLMYLPELVPTYGIAVLFAALMLFTAASLFMLPLLPSYEIEPLAQKSATKPLNRKALLMCVLAIFLFQGANMGLFAYMIGLGRAAGLELSFMSPSLAMASWIALIGAFLVIVVGTRFGRVMPIMLGTLITALCTWLLHYSVKAEVYLVTNVVIGITWAFVLPYLFGICSQLDSAGRLAALAGFVSKMGLATGPMVAALLLKSEDYSLMIDVATVGLILAALVAISPAKLLDRTVSSTT